ncbi:CDP-glycerol glycerophosphotransferase family protein [Demequina sp. NBRC 110057]|uniref:CDP-glycerol glycerophosphotransferase family protein n=1 Tax=Demequina sp. NBRC 110057 TaxID=1570346 RepID=UPI000A026026|nr:CDP-glycerol glycerophosphotransferase family protein [Demequina sp. NBRC 110057]
MLSSLKGLLRPARLIALALAALAATAVALEASWLVWAVIALSVALVALPWWQPLTPAMEARLPGVHPAVARLVAGAGRSAAAMWLALGALGTDAALREDSRDWAVALVFLIGAGSAGFTTLAAAPALRHDLRVSTLAARASRAVPWGIAAIYVAGVLTLPALARWPQAPSTALAVAAGLLAASGAAVVLRSLASRGRQRKRALDEVARLAPAFVVYQSGPHGSAYQLAMWLPFLERSGLPFVVVARQEALYTELRGITDAPVVYAGSLQAVDDVLAHSGGTVIYVNNAAANTHAVRLYQLHHVQILHGDSDKASSRNPISAMYDELWVAGQAAIDRYGDHGIVIPQERFRIVGRPQVAGIDGASGAATPRVALYAPTWNGFFGDANYSSLPHGLAIVQALLDEGLTVIFREHPYSSGSAQLRAAIADIHGLLADDAERTGRQHRYGPGLFAELDLIGCFNASDIAVTDISAVPNDYLFSGKPFAIMEMQPDTLARKPGRPTLAAAAYTARPGDDIPAWIGRLVRDDGKATSRAEAREHYLGPFAREGYEDVFVQTLRETVATHRLVGELDTEE